MSNNPFGDDDLDPEWGPPAPKQSGKDIIADTLKKEAILKDIQAAQEDLRILLGRADKVQGEVDKLTSGNATLQMYIDNLTKQMARR